MPESTPRVGRWDSCGHFWHCDGATQSADGCPCYWSHAAHIAHCENCGLVCPPFPETPAPRVDAADARAQYVAAIERERDEALAAVGIPKPSPRFLTDAQVVGREPIAGLEQARLVGDLKAAIERVADHRWIISTAYEGGNFGFQVNTRDAVQRGKKTVKYSPLPGSFALTAPDAALNGLRVEAAERPTTDGGTD